MVSDRRRCGTGECPGVTRRAIKAHSVMPVGTVTPRPFHLYCPAGCDEYVVVVMMVAAGNDRVADALQRDTGLPCGVPHLYLALHRAPGLETYIPTVVITRKSSLLVKRCTRSKSSASGAHLINQPTSSELLRVIRLTVRPTHARAVVGFGIGRNGEG